jgi:L-threonylcarbamoyladenylate synthase
MRLTKQAALVLERCVRDEGVAIFPADTVYGLGCDPDQPRAVERLNRLKGRPPGQPAAVMFFTVELALQSLPQLKARERAAISALLPGALTLLLPNREGRFALACGQDASTIGIRVPLLRGELAVLRAVRTPLMQSSANLSGGLEARRLLDVAPELRRAVDLELDGGELPGRASTVLDLRDYQLRGRWRVIRQGPVSAQELAQLL